MKVTLTKLISRLNAPEIAEARVISWSSPIPFFGDLSQSLVASLGLNPSNREFVDVNGHELEGERRRFHTLRSLGLTRWSDVDKKHLQLIADACQDYFVVNPYHRWFKKMDYVISDTKASYYCGAIKACHLDLIPYATSCKWTALTSFQRSSLLSLSSDALGLVLRDSPIRLLILNGSTVVEQFQRIACTSLEKRAMSNWALPRRFQPDVPGFSYKGTVRNLSGVSLGRDLLVLGINHNIQSSFGVTTQVMSAIRRWIGKAASEVLE